ncbi:MAG: AzlD domain-containing protein [Clostridia bacterium]|nr:AzlD domain-containing protein [Clostridia bacterium]
MNDQLWVTIVGMMLVTFIPRLVPFLMVSERQLPPKLQQFLEYIPYTALGALVIPGVFNAIPDMPAVSIAGIGFAFFYGWYKGGLIIPVLGSILIVFLILLI